MDHECAGQCLYGFFGHLDQQLVYCDQNTGKLVGASTLVILPPDLTAEQIQELKENFFRAMPKKSPPTTPFHVRKLGGEVVCKLSVSKSLEYDPESSCRHHNCNSNLEYKLYLYEKHVLTVTCRNGGQPRISFTAPKGGQCLCCTCLLH